MADRGVIVLRIGKIPKPIFIYCHNGGSNLPELVQDVLRDSRINWHSGTYLASDIFRALVEGKEKHYGFGLSPHEMDGSHDKIHIFTNDRRIVIGKMAWTFDDYILSDVNTLAA